MQAAVQRAYCFRLPDRRTRAHLLHRLRFTLCWRAPKISREEHTKKYNGDDDDDDARHATLRWAFLQLIFHLMIFARCLLLLHAFFILSLSLSAFAFFSLFLHLLLLLFFLLFRFANYRLFLHIILSDWCDNTNQTNNLHARRVRKR